MVDPELDDSAESLSALDDEDESGLEHEVRTPSGPAYAAHAPFVSVLVLSEAAKLEEVANKPTIIKLNIFSMI